MNSIWRSVTKEEASNFVKNYPRKLEHNFFMDSHSWHDFTLGPLEDSFVIMADIHYQDSELDWRIRRDLYA